MLVKTGDTDRAGHGQDKITAPDDRLIRKKTMAENRLRIHASSLYYFDTVRTAGSIREAARRLNIASSAVNRQILALEAQINAPLFVRLSSGLRLTPEGEILSQHVISVLRDSERVYAAFDALKGLHSGHVEVVTLEGICHHIVPASIVAMNKRFPRLTVGISISETENVPRAVINGDAHLGLAFGVPPTSRLKRLANVSFPLGGLVRPDSPMARKKSLSISDLRDVPLILPKRNFANRVQVRNLLYDASIADRGLVEAGSVELMKQLVIRGLGMAIMTRVGSEQDLSAGRLVHIPLFANRKPITSHLGLYAREDTALPLAAEALARNIIDLMKSVSTK